MADPFTPEINTSGTANPRQADTHYQAGLQAERDGDRWTAIEQLHKAYSLDPDNLSICFRLAYCLDLVGEEQQALNLYEQCCDTELPHINALMNLAVLYEDQGDYPGAEKCLRQVVETNPNHLRARLFLKDVQACRHMYYDDDPGRPNDQQHTLMETPVTDFELSVRARNCLRKMNIRTLGDLLRTTEAELLGYKNFGETSLHEIKAMLNARGMRLGQALDAQAEAVREEIYEQLRSAGGDEQVLTDPVDELDLSMRARKALSLLNIQTIGDLVSYTEAELLGIKNFGMTSLDEVKEKLTERGLSLRKLEE